MIVATADRLTRALRAVAVVSLAVAAVAPLWRPSLDAELPDESAGALAADSTRSFPDVPSARAADAQRVAQGNIFAAARRPPARRYVPGGTPPGTGAADPEAALPFDPAYTGESPTLLGTVLDALGDRALILIPQVDSTARFYRVGERAGPFRVRRIEAGRVVLDGPAGRVVLDLLKPNEARP
jgi:hypothetical protein